MNRKRKAEGEREGGNKRRKQSRGGRGGAHRNEHYSEGSARGGRDRAAQIEEVDVMNDDEENDKTHVYEDDEAANLAKKIRGKKWRDQKRRLGLEEEEDSDASEEEGEGPALGQLGEEGDTVAELGPNMMPFNVREELEGGDFDRGLGAVRRKEEVKREALKGRLAQGTLSTALSDDEDSEDEDPGDRAWYEEQETRARDDKHYYARIGQNKAVVDDEDSAEEFNSLLARKHLVQQLNYGENVFAAMRRLKPANDKRNKKEREADPTVQRFNALVESADQLMNHGFPNVYNDTRERIAESIERDENKANNSSARGVRRVSHGGAEQYEYKWGAHESEVYGPYALSDLQAWLNQGHFSAEVVARVVNSENEFVPVSQLLQQ